MAIIFSVSQNNVYRGIVLWKYFNLIKNIHLKSIFSMWSPDMVGITDSGGKNSVKLS